MLRAYLMDVRHPNNLGFTRLRAHGSPLLLQFYMLAKSEVLMSSRRLEEDLPSSRLILWKFAQLADILSHYFRNCMAGCHCPKKERLEL